MNIPNLWAKDKNAWCREFFPEYARVFGGYPKAIPVRYFMASGTTGAPEMTPWEGWGSPIMASGHRFVPATRTGEPGTAGHYEEVPEDEYRAWCETCNFYKNGFKTPLGGDGLNPAVFIGAVDDRRTAYYLRNLKYKKYNLLVKPDYITCPTGTYLPMRGPSVANPYGVNSSFVPRGYKVPGYISTRYGPDHFTPPSYIPLPDPVPTQAEYDKARYSVYL